MPSTERTEPVYEASPERITTLLETAEFLQVLARSDGGSLAAAALVTHACEALDIPFHVSAIRTRNDLEEHIHASDRTASILVLGAPHPDDTSSGTSPASQRVYEAVRTLGLDPDPVLSLAGILASDALPGDLPEPIRSDADLPREPGLAIPTQDTVDGLVHTTLAHTSFSADSACTRTRLENLTSDWETDLSGKHLASLLAIDVIMTDPTDAPRASIAIERALHPYVLPGPFRTLGGYADVLTALAESHPGLAITLTPTTGPTDRALDDWRLHGRNTHTAITSATTSRRGDILLAELDHGPVETAARLIRDYLTDAPIVLTIADTDIGIATTESARSLPVETAASAVNGSALVTPTRGYAQLPPDRTPDFLDHLTPET